MYSTTSKHGRNRLQDAAASRRRELILDGAVFVQRNHITIYDPVSQSEVMELKNWLLLDVQPHRSNTDFNLRLHR